MMSFAATWMDLKMIILETTIKKSEMMSFAATWMDLKMIILSEIRERQIPYDITYM